jgi:hypothetical protein
MVVTQWRSQGLQSKGDALSGKGTNTVGGPENFEIQSLWNAILCILGEILQNSEDYNIIIR